MALTNFPNGLTSFGIPVLPQNSSPFTGKAFFVDPVSGTDGNPGTSPDLAFATLYAAHSACTAGKNDVVYLIGNGAASGSARLSLALAQTINSAATGGALLWTKNATHLVGVASSSNNSRARIAPPTGTYTAATFVDTTMVNVTATGCSFTNISCYAGFSTGAATFVGWTEAGGRNTYTNCEFQGMNDAASAAGAGSRSLLVTGSVGENTFNNCIVGDDTTARTAANASLEFAGATPRNTFNRCIFPFFTSGGGTGALGILGTGAGCMDRWQLFDECIFINSIKSTSATVAVIASLTNASPGGLLLMRDPIAVGCTKYGDTIALANTYFTGPVPTGATTGLAVAPA